MQEHKCARLPPVAQLAATLVLAWVGAFGLLFASTLFELVALQAAAANALSSTAKALRTSIG